MKRRTEKSVDLHVRLPQKLYEIIFAKAQTERRPVNSEIILRLEKTCTS